MSGSRKVEAIRFSNDGGSSPKYRKKISAAIRAQANISSINATPMSAIWLALLSTKVTWMRLAWSIWATVWPKRP